MKEPGPLEAYIPWLTFAVFRVGEMLIAALFWGALPNWMIITWWALVAVSGSCADLLTGTVFPPKVGAPKPPTWPFWFNAICFSFAAFFLYVPGNLGYQGLLNVSLLCVAALFSLLSVSGASRLLAAVVLLPTSIRYLLEADRIHFLLGMGGILISGALAAVAHQAKRMLEEQRLLRVRAEHAVEAVASVNLAKARFFAAASHDLRQPVHAIGLYAEFLRGLQVQHPQQKQALEGIRQAWHSLDKLLGEVLDLTKLDANAMQPQFQSVDVLALLRDAAQQHAAAAQNKRIRLEVLGDAPRYVRADFLMLQRVVSNVLTNAIKFSPEGSRIALLSRRANLQGRDAWRIQVRDAGPGVEESEQSRIFEEFIQTQNAARQSAQGFGLGLAIAKRFCTVMAGVIELRSLPGQGMTMNIILASAEPGEQVIRIAGVAAPSAILQPIGTGDEQILLVEDDPHVAAGMSLLMSDWGFRVHCAETAVDALQLRHSATLALCDVRMPGTMSGIELAIQLRARGMQVMLMSGETEAALRKQADSEGLTLLVKPVAPAVLHEALKTLMRVPS